MLMLNFVMISYGLYKKINEFGIFIFYNAFNDWWLYD